MSPATTKRTYVFITPQRDRLRYLNIGNRFTYDAMLLCVTLTFLYRPEELYSFCAELYSGRNHHSLAEFHENQRDACNKSNIS